MKLQSLSLSIIHGKRKGGSAVLYHTQECVFQRKLSACFCEHTAGPQEQLWRRQWHPTPVLLPGKSHGQRSLVGCSPWVR